MTPAARLQAAIDLLDAIDAQRQAPADAVVGAWLRDRRYMGSRDRAAVTERVYDILRLRGALDWWLGESGDDNRRRVLAHLVLVEGQDAGSLAPLFAGLRHGPAPLSDVETTLVDRLSGRDLDDPAVPESVRLGCPEWLEGPFAESLGPDWRDDLAALLVPAPVDLRVNTLATDRDGARAALAAEDIAATPTDLSPWGLRLVQRQPLGRVQAFRDGLVEVQDEGSQLAALFTGARPGELVVDACAGAGGKTLALAAMMANRGRLVAGDVSEPRLRRAAARLKRASVHNAERRQWRRPGDRWIKRHAGKADRVLVDAPCTGTGTWRRNPDQRWRLDPGDLAACIGLQRAILEWSAGLVRPGGHLAYVTCSLLRSENEDQMAWFLDQHTQFQAVDGRDLWQEALGAACPEPGPWLRLRPARDGTDGFFFALLRRRA